LLGACSQGNPRQELQRVIILGAGTMGKQIGVQCAAHLRYYQDWSQLG
jgi:hypothetical protein